MLAAQSTSGGDRLTWTFNTTQNKRGWMEYALRAAMKKRAV